MHAVHRKVLEVDEGAEPRRGSDRDVMREMVPRESVCREVVVTDRTLELRLDILKERAALRDVDDLQPAAKSQQGLRILDAPARELELDAITIGINASEFLVRRFAVGGRIHVDAAGNQDPRARLVGRAQDIGVVQQRDQDRRAAG